MVTVLILKSKNELPSLCIYILMWY